MIEWRIPQLGMSDADLETACKEARSGLSPWAFWTSELYCYGKCIRHISHFPSFLPLFVYADHGVALHSNLFPHESTNTARVHFTSHPLKAERYKLQTNKKVVQIPHPWVLYRRSKGIQKESVRKGTLVFFTHHAPGVKWENHDTDRYFKLLAELPEKYQPVVICLHMHDINSGLHRDLRRRGFPLVTAGNTSSTHFVDRFYKLVAQFSYATSQGWGSQVAYCVELGVPYFFLGDRPTLVNLSHKELPLGKISYQDEHHRVYDERAEALFNAPVDEPTIQQRRFVESVLGLDSRIGRVGISWILWREFFYNWRSWWSLWSAPASQAISRYGVIGLLRRLYGRLKDSGD